MKTFLIISGILLLINSILLGYLGHIRKRQDEFVDRITNPYILNELLKYTRVARPDDPFIEELERMLHLQPGEELKIELHKDDGK